MAAASFLGPVLGRESQRGAASVELISRANHLERAITQLTARKTSARRPRSAVSVRLPADTQLIEYFITDGELVAFIHDGHDVTAVRGLATLDQLEWGLQQLVVQFDRFLTGPEFVARHLGQLEAASKRVVRAGSVLEARTSPQPPSKDTRAPSRSKRLCTRGSARKASRRPATTSNFWSSGQKKRSSGVE